MKNRMHPCLQPQQGREAEVDRLLGLGARMFNDRPNPDGTGRAVLADPQGNAFCVLAAGRAGEHRLTATRDRRR